MKFVKYIQKHRCGGMRRPATKKILENNCLNFLGAWNRLYLAAGQTLSGKSERNARDLRCDLS
jgi:hypothetical protein